MSTYLRTGPCKTKIIAGWGDVANVWYTLRWGRHSINTHGRAHGCAPKQCKLLHFTRVPTGVTLNARFQCTPTGVPTGAS